MNAFEDLVEFEKRYRPFFDGAISLGNFDGYYGSLNVLYYMIWRSLFWKNIAMSFCFGDAEKEDCYLFQDFINERAIELSGYDVDKLIVQVKGMSEENGWLFYTGKRTDYKILLPECGGIMVDDFLNHVEKQLGTETL